MIKIEINNDNAAFENADELLTVLETIACAILDGKLQGFAYDYNGNKVGTFSIE